SPALRGVRLRGPAPAQPHRDDGEPHRRGRRGPSHGRRGTPPPEPAADHRPDDDRGGRPMTLVRSDIDSIFSITKAIGPVSIATDTNTLSSAIDMSAKPGWKVLLVGSVGTRTDGTYTFSLKQSDTSGGTYSDVSPSSGSLTAV